MTLEIKLYAEKTGLAMLLKMAPYSVVVHHNHEVLQFQLDIF